MKNDAQEAYTALFNYNGLQQSRIIAFSKSNYKSDHPNDLVLFNANVLTASAGKIYYGDLNLTLEERKLQEIANTLSETLYILEQNDCRFENEFKSTEELLKKAIMIVKPNQDERL